MWSTGNPGGGTPQQVSELLSDGESAVSGTTSYYPSYLSDTPSGGFANAANVNGTASNKLSPNGDRSDRRASIISRGSQGGFQDMGLPEEKKLGCLGRFWNIRNATIIVNVGILAVAILTMTLVTYFLSTSSAAQTLSESSKAGADRVVSSLLVTFHQVETDSERLGYNFGLNVYENVSNIQMIKTFYGELLYSSNEMQGKYAAIFNDNPVTPSFVIVLRSLIDDDLDIFSYVGGYRDPIPGSDLTLWDLNIDTCTLADTSCILPDFSRVNFSGPFDPVTRPWFERATQLNRSTWTSLYLFSNGNLGITMANPAYSDDTLRAVLGNDLEITVLSNYLQDVLFGLIAKNDDIRLYLVSKNTTDFGPMPCSQAGILVNTNVPELTQYLLDSQNCPILPQDIPDEIISSSAIFIQEQCGPFKDLTPTPSRIECYSMKFNQNVIQIREFKTLFGDIDWLVVLVVPEKVYLGTLQKLFQIIIPVLAGGMFAVSILLSFLLTLYITRPLKKLTKQLLTVANLEFDHLKYATTRDRLQLSEVARLEGAMNVMTTGLKSFSKYVPRDLVRLLVKMRREAVLGVDERELTVFFSDIADFTSISEALDPDSLVTLMGEYLQEMSTIVTRNHGIVDKFIGDAVMAFWNAPSDLPNHALIACEVALQSQERLVELQRRWSESNYPMIRIRIGLNTGNALVGNLGAPDRMNFTCIGDNVNLASRLEGLNKMFASQIMLSEYTYVQVQHQFLCRMLGLIAVKGKSVPVKVYELLERRETATVERVEKIETYNQAMEAYLRREFAVAHHILTQYLERHPEDLAASMHLDFCQKYLENPPDNQWTGVLKLTEK